jgi:hypothetical protein
MSDFGGLGRILILLGVLLVGVGGLILALGRAGIPLGSLPGDIRIERENISCIVPIATSIVLSILLTLILNLVIRFLNR